MRSLYPLGFVLLMTGSALAQSKIDTLKQKLHTEIQTNDTENVANYFGQIGYYFLEHGAYDSAIAYLLRSINTSAEDSSLAASNYNSLGVCYHNIGVPDSALFYYNKALLIYDHKKDTANALTIENNMAIIFKNQGLYEEALEKVFRALNKLERMAPDRTLASSYNTVASIHAGMGEYQKALQYYTKSLAVRKFINYERGIGQSYHNIGEAYANMGMLDSALVNLFRAIAIKERLEDHNGIGTTNNVIGVVYLKQKKYALAESYFLQAAKTKNQTGEKRDEGITLNNLAELKLATSAFAEAERVLLSAENLLSKTEAMDQLKRTLELKVKLYDAMRDPRKALAAMTQLGVIKDSLLTQQKVQSLFAMHIRYETEKMEQQIELLQGKEMLHETQLKTRGIWIAALITVVVLLTVIVLLVYFYLRTAKRNKERVETLLKELHHRVKNNLQILSGILGLQSQHLTDKVALQAIKSSESRVNAMALIHRKLYAGEPDRTVDIKEYVNELVTYLVHTYGFYGKEINIDLELEEIHLDVDKAIPLGLILNELVSNAFKYAYANNPAPELQISVNSVGRKNMFVRIKDNGPGLRENNAQPSASFGLKMVNMMINELRGKLTRIPGNGTTYELNIPLS